MRGPNICSDYQQGTYELPRSQQALQCMQLHTRAAVALTEAFMILVKAATTGIPLAAAFQCLLAKELCAQTMTKDIVQMSFRRP